MAQQSIEEIGILKSKTKEQRLDDIIPKIDTISNNLEKAKTVGDWVIATNGLSLKLTTIAFQLSLWKHFNLDD